MQSEMPLFARFKPDLTSLLSADWTEGTYADYYF